MPTVIVMCGLQGSGKSTKARYLKEEMGNCEIVSSDAIRKEFDNNITNDKVFKIYYARAREFLKAGTNVILDATNITIKSRKQIFEQLKGIDCTKECYVMNVPINICAERLLERNQDTKNQIEVPLDVLYKYQKSFEMPFYEEGWDDIEINTIQSFVPSQYELCIDSMDNFEQKNSHHKYTVGEHGKKLEKFIKKYKFPKCTGIFHDIGKLFTQTIGEDGQAHYYQHHNVGAYFLLSHTYLIEDINILDLVFYVNYHMFPFTWQTDKAKEKWKKIFGEHKFEMLQILNEGDKKASGTQ